MDRLLFFLLFLPGMQTSRTKGGNSCHLINVKTKIHTEGAEQEAEKGHEYGVLPPANVSFCTN